MENNPDALQCTKLSCYESLYEALSYGLSLSPTLGHAYLIPYGKKMTFRPGYKGIEKKILEANPNLLCFSAQLVFREEIEQGKYSWKDVNGEIQINHEYILEPKNPDVVAAYTRVQYKDGYVQYSGLMLKEELAAVRSLAARGSKAWAQFPLQMYRKCTLRRAFAHFAATPELENLIRRFDEDFDMSEGKRIIDVTPGSGNRTETLAGRINAKKSIPPQQIDEPEPIPDEPRPPELPLPQGDEELWGDSPQA